MVGDTNASHRGPHVVYTLDGDGIELPCGVWAHQHRLVESDQTREESAGDDEANTADIEILVDQKLGGLLILRATDGVVACETH